MAKLFVCGDIINYSHADGRVCADDLTAVIQDADFAICNFEAPLQGAGKAQPKMGPHHSQQAGSLQGLKAQGFDLLLLANNHIMDFGPEGLQKTQTQAAQADLLTLGAGPNAEHAYQPLVRDIGGVKVAMLNACEAQFGVIDTTSSDDEAGYAWINAQRLDAQIVMLKQTCDLIIVFAHAGLENVDIPQAAWRERYRGLCDLGADMVIGSHPHVPQGFESYNGKHIFYSLGNFYFDSKNYKDKEDCSFSLLLSVEPGKAPAFELIHHYKQGGQVRLAPPDKQVDTGTLCRKLSDGYEQAHDLMSLRISRVLQQRLQGALSPIGWDGSLRRFVKNVLLTLLGRRKKADSDLLQLHLLRNESYRFATLHALALKARSKR